MRPLVVILGPTASGKSSLALQLAQELDGEIINADALQVYRRLDIGTAKPTPAEQQEVPHHLVDILDPNQPFSAGEFARLARQAVADIHARGREALVVGGSGLYLKALLEGLSPLPQADPDVRKELDRRLREEGLASLYSQLQQVDPECASRLAVGDRQRILRALEVWHQTGVGLSTWQRRKAPAEACLPAVRIGLTLPRSILYDRIRRRVGDMVEAGWAREVRSLLDSGLDPKLPAFQAIGYRQMVRHVLGEWDLKTAMADTVQATRRYAKRQLTWFRRDTGIRWIPALKQPDLSLLELLRSGGGKLAE